MIETIPAQSSIYDLQSEKDYLNHYNKFSYIQPFEKLFSKFVYNTLVLGILNSNLYL